MMFSQPKTLHWTFHSRAKMRQYGLSEQRVRRILHAPARIEEGVAPRTVALMQKAGSTKHPYELWVMVVDKRSVRKVISAWRYPGVTKPRSESSLMFIRQELDDYLEIDKKEVNLALKSKMAKSKWFRNKRTSAAEQAAKFEFRKKFAKSRWFPGSETSGSASRSKSRTRSSTAWFRPEKKKSAGPVNLLQLKHGRGN